MEQTNEKRKILRTAAECAAAFAAAALFVLCMAAMLGFAPFGENTVNYDDGVIQYLDFFAYYKRLLSGEVTLLYTFEKTLGGGNIAVFSYYLASPFNLLAVFFTQEQIPALFTVLTLCKAATAAATFTLYLRIRFPRMKPVPAVCLALCYALGQYTFSQASNTMWLDGIYMLPLILLGTYRLVQNRRKKLLLILSVAASILFNWYSAGINCMFCILYYIYEDASENRFGGIKAYIGRALPFIGSLALGVLLSACLFLPTLLALRGGRAGFDVLDIIALIGNYVENLFSAVTNFRVGGTSEQGSVSLYCGYFAFIGMGAYFFTQAEKGRKRNASAVFLLFTVLLFYVSVFIFAFSLFKSAESYWYRYSYVGVFAMLNVSAKFYEKVGNEPIRMDTRLWWAIGLVLAVLCLGWGLESFPFAMLALGLTVLLVYVYGKTLQGPSSAEEAVEENPAALISAAGRRASAVWTSARKRQLAAAGACLLLAAGLLVELGFNAASLMRTYFSDSVGAFADYVTQQQAQVNALEEYDGGFYRVNQTDTFNKGYEGAGLTANYNESIAYGYHSVNGYTSDPDNNSRFFLEKLGYRTNGLNMNIVNTSVLGADALLGVKYVFSSYDINGLEKLEELGTYNGKSTYYNPYALPAAFTYDPAGREIEDGNMFEYQNSLYSYLLGEEVTLYREAETQRSTDEDGNTVYTVTVPDGPHALYADFTILTTSYVKVTVNGGKATDMGGWLSPNVLYIPDGDGSPTVCIGAENEISTSCRIYWLDLDALAQAAQKLQANAADADISDGHVSCSVNAEAGERLYLSVPFEDGWSIKVNGKDADYELVGGCMISVALEEGENTVTLDFSVPGLGPGIALTVIAALCTAALAFADARGKRLRDLPPARVKAAGAKLLEKLGVPPEEDAADTESDATPDTGAENTEKESDGEAVPKRKGLLRRLWSSPLIREIVRFLLVGGGATIVDFLAMSLVLWAMQPAIYPNFLSVFFGGTQEPSTLATVIGTGCGFLVGLAFNYIFSVLFVYKEKGNSKTMGGFLLFSLLSAGGLAIHLLGMYLGYDLLHINEWIVKIILTAVVLVYNYITRKVLIFRKKPSGEEKEEQKDETEE